MINSWNHKKEATHQDYEEKKALLLAKEEEPMEIKLLFIGPR